MSEPASAGALLRAAREKQGLHIAALAAAIKVTPRKLDALENDRWAELPDATFTRALAQTVCRSLKIDARPVLDLLPPAGAVALEPATGLLNAPFRERPGREDPGLGNLAIKPMVWAATLLMVAAVALYFVPDGMGLNLARLRGPATAQAPAASAVLPTASTAPPAPADMGLTPAPVDAAVSALPAPALEAAASAPAGPAVGSAVSTVASMATAPAAAPAAAASAPAGLLQLHARQESWIQVRDARGLVLLSRTVLAGESVGLDGRLPMQLTIGNAAATQVGLRGRPVDLAPSTRDNVARLELQ